MKKDKGLYTVRYALINILYFVCFCTIHAFAAVFLLDKGFSNTEVGVLLAIANVVSAIAQPFIAGLIDKPGFFTNRNVIMGCSGIIIIGSLILMAVNDIRVIIFIIFALIYMIQFAYQPVLTALVFEYQEAGCNIFYGLARGLGSAGFAIASAFMGGIVERNGVNVLLYGNIITMVLLILITFFFKKPEGALSESKAEVSGLSQDEGLNSGEEGKKTENEAHNNIFEFIKVYPSFFVLLLSVVLLFFGHNMLNDYLIQIIRNVGGAETELGYATFLAAILELPAMATISLIIKKVSSNKLLAMAGIFFTVKVLIMVFAGNMFMVYLSQAFQMLAYAVFIPASAYYVNENMQKYDQVKGQAFITSCFTLAGVFSSLVCGVVLDHMGVKAMLLIGLAVSVIGTLIMLKAVLVKKADN